MNTTTFAVRRAAPSDRDEVIALSRAISEHDFIPEVYDFWMTRTGPDGFYVAEQDGRIVGCYCLELPGPGQGYLYAMRIHPEVQGQGIGSQLCRMQVEQARSIGSTDLYLLSVLDNHRAHRTVEKNGFVNRGEWLVYDAVRGFPPQPPVRKARPALPEERGAIQRFRMEREELRGSLAGLICSHYIGWTIKTAAPEDWEPANVVVFPGESGLEGAMLLSDTDEGLLIRWLDGSAEAAADLLSFAVRRAAETGQSGLALSLPLASEPLLAPLGLNPADAFRAYVFHHALGPVASL